MAAVVDWAGERVSVLGHSYGGVCALEAARLTDAIGRLVLYEAPVGFVQSPPWVVDRLQALLDADERDELLALFMREVAGLPAEQIELLRSLPAWEARLAAAHTIPREERANREYVFDADRFRALHVPTLLLQAATARTPSGPPTRPCKRRCPTAASPSCRASGTPRWTPAPTCSSPRSCASWNPRQRLRHNSLPPSAAAQLTDPRGDRTMTTTAPDRTDALVERLLGATIGALELFSVYLGVELGLYPALANGPAGRRRAGAARRDRQALRARVARAAGRRGPDRGRGRRPPPSRAPLPALARPRPRALPRRRRGARGAVRAHDRRHRRCDAQVKDAYRSGDGVPYESYSHAFRHGQGHINRPAFTHELPSDWLAAMPDVVTRLEGASHPRVADIGCGQGWSTLAIAGAFLNAWVDGLDLDPGSIADARRHAAEAGLDGRVRFIEADAARWPTTGPTTSSCSSNPCTT